MNNNNKDFSSFNNNNQNSHRQNQNNNHRDHQHSNSNYHHNNQYQGGGYHNNQNPDYKPKLAQPFKKTKWADQITFPWALQENSSQKQEILNKLGKGTQGIVQKVKLKKINFDKEKAKDSNYKDKVTYQAMKQILIENDFEGFPITALREIKILKRLDSEYVVKLVEVVNSRPEEYGENKTDFFLVFEQCRFDLSGLLDYCKFENIVVPASFLKSMALQLFKGLAYLHSHSIVHRDLKLSNLLVGANNCVKIADFGLARQLRSDIEENYTQKVVTLWYRCPELILGQRRYKFEIDIWSVGCIIAEILLGQPLFSEDDEAKVQHKMQNILGDLKEFWPDIAKLPYYQKFRESTAVLQKVGKANYGAKLKEYLKNIESKSKYVRAKIDDECFDLIEKCLKINPGERITAEQAMEHPWFKSEPLPDSSSLPCINYDIHEQDIKKKRDREKFFKANPHLKGNKDYYAPTANQPHKHQPRDRDNRDRVDREPRDKVERPDHRPDTYTHPQANAPYHKYDANRKFSKTSPKHEQDKDKVDNIRDYTVKPINDEFKKEVRTEHQSQGYKNQDYSNRSFNQSKDYNNRDTRDPKDREFRDKGNFNAQRDNREGNQNRGQQNREGNFNRDNRDTREVPREQNRDGQRDREQNDSRDKNNVSNIIKRKREE